MAPKQLKPPYYHVAAHCPQCGIITAQRKPHPKAGQRTESGGIQQPKPLSIVCSCRYHAKVISAVLVSA
jgi:hypothetical protein